MFLKLARKGKTSLGAYVLGIFVVILAYFIGQLPVSLALMGPISSGELGEEAMYEFQETKDFSIFGLDSNYLLFLLLLMYVVAFLALWLAVKYIHKKSLKDIITGRQTIDWNRIFFGFTLWLIFSFLAEFISYLINPDLYVFQGIDGSFWLLLVIAVLMLPIQTSFEEIFFRGYLLQGTSLITTWRIIPLFITSVLFGVVHIMNPEVTEFGFVNMMVYYIGVGLFLGILTLLDDGVELALGVHAATNIFGAVFVTYEASALQTEALVKLNEVQVNTMSMIFFAWALLFLFICRKKYNWTNLKKVYGRINLESNA